MDIFNGRYAFPDKLDIMKEVAPHLLPKERRYVVSPLMKPQGAKFSEVAGIHELIENGIQLKVPISFKSLDKAVQGKTELHAQI